MWTDGNGLFYVGDCRQGDRAATSEEIAAQQQVGATAAVDAKLAQVRAVREAMLNRMAGIAFVAQLGGDAVTVDAFKTARLALLDITTGCPTDPLQVDAFIQAKYTAIVAALPATLINAFAGVDA